MMKLLLSAFLLVVVAANGTKVPDDKAAPVTATTAPHGKAAPGTATTEPPSEAATHAPDQPLAKEAGTKKESDAQDASTDPEPKDVTPPVFHESLTAEDTRKIALAKYVDEHLSGKVIHALRNVANKVPLLNEQMIPSSKTEDDKESKSGTTSKNEDGKESKSGETETTTTTTTENGSG